MGLEIKEYLSRVGVRRVTELDAALIEAFGQTEGERHIEKLTELFDEAELRLLHGAQGHGTRGHGMQGHETHGHGRHEHEAEGAMYLRRQDALVDYLNQSAQMSLLAASFYDRVFFRRAMECMLQYERFWQGDIFDMGCGNGILTCFLALRYPASAVTGFDLSRNAVSVATELAGRLCVSNARFAEAKAAGQMSNAHFAEVQAAGQAHDAHYASADDMGKCDTLFSCRTAHENVPWRPLRESAGLAPLSIEGQARLHEGYAKELASLVRLKGHLISIERYEEDGAYAGFLMALERAGFAREKGTHVRFSCKNGDEMGAFQAMVFQRVAEKR